MSVDSILASAMIQLLPISSLKSNRDVFCGFFLRRAACLRTMTPLILRHVSVTLHRISVTLMDTSMHIRTTMLTTWSPVNARRVHAHNIVVGVSTPTTTL